MFSNDTFRAAWLAQFGVASNAQYDQSVDQTLDNLADHLEKYLDVAGILAAAR
jgi:adenosylcobyric acid synthase